jgi:tRNA dimethylallyltransferase
MLESGFLDEVRTLQKRNDLSAEHPSMRAVGYRQVWRHLAGQLSLEEASEQAIAATRQLAKRQITWLRARRLASWLDAAHRDVQANVSAALAQSGMWL